MKLISQNIKEIFHLSGYALKAKLSSRRRTPLICSFKVTHACNLKCQHCPFWRNPFPETLSLDQGKELLFQLYRQGVRLLIFEGGEPLLYPQLDRLVKEAKSLFFSVGITTNGTLDLGQADPDIYFVSIDGLQKTHDRIRGKSFDRAMNNIRKYSNKKIIANITISALNYDQIEPMVRYLEDKVYGLTIQFFFPFPSLADLQLKPEQRVAVLDKLIALKKSGFSILDSYTCLNKMKDNSWECHDFLVASVEPDGNIYYGCYLKHRLEDYNCQQCGYSVHCEASSAYDLRPDAIITAKRIFWD